MIIITDIGRDVDDALALTYAIVSGLPISDIIITSRDTVESANICRNILKHLSNFPNTRNIKISLGSSGPLSMGEVHENTYHGPFSEIGDATYNILDPDRMVKSSAVVLAPSTDFLRLIKTGKITRAIFMGSVKNRSGFLEPDMQAYNFRCDPKAIQETFKWQDLVLFAFVGKDLAYQVPFKGEDFQKLANTGHPVGKFLQEHALMSLAAFRTKNPELYERIYKDSGNVCYCYDPLCVLAMNQAGLFTFDHFNGHLIGSRIEGQKAHDALIDTMVTGLLK